MLDMAKVGKDDVVYDLGCGDGRIVAIAAKKYGARGVGVDIDPDRIKDSHKTLKKYGVEKLVEIRQGDALKVKDLNKATVVMLYMLRRFMEKLEPIAQKTLKPAPASWPTISSSRTGSPSSPSILRDLMRAPAVLLRGKSRAPK